MNRSIFRFEDYTTRQDPKVKPEYRAVCESGEVELCGAKSETEDSAADVDDWMRDHMQATGHRCFRRTFEDFAELLPTEELRKELEPAKVQRVTA
ncbi:DUF7848 domain-containing protein [Streptomyces sp. NBC_01244]|uniref:DUF7848 domain-containing protein n=1 Tax=Streptomyces sp. NBC_01244 TaxID=2903797 RepID=UPI002E13A842|nr:hypothetical protein OG247_23505 [Streptomyces sp. NBC_01244]